MTHDPMCRTPYFDDDPTDCDCDLIARVRADDRKRLALELAEMPNADTRGLGLLYRSDVVAALEGLA